MSVVTATTNIDALLDHAAMVGAEPCWYPQANGCWCVRLVDPIAGKHEAFGATREEAAGVVLDEIARRMEEC